MPSAFATLQRMILGYLNGAGLGALSMEALNQAGRDKATLLKALIVIGPFGALLGLLIAEPASERK